MQGQAVRLHASNDGTIGDWIWATSERPEFWTGRLPSAVERLGYGPDTPERIAAVFVQLLSELSSALDRGEAEKAASIAFYAGMCWQKQFNDKAAKAGAGLVKTRRMGARARTRYDEETKREWFLEALRLEDEQGITTTHKQAAQLIKAGRGYGASLETIRKAIDARKARMREK